MKQSLQNINLLKIVSKGKFPIYRFFDLLCKKINVSDIAAKYYISEFMQLLLNKHSMQLGAFYQNNSDDVTNIKLLNKLFQSILQQASAPVELGCNYLGRYWFYNSIYYKYIKQIGRTNRIQ